MEALGLGIFMIAASAFAILIFHPRSGLAASLGDGLWARATMGLAMAGTALALVYSPWGKQSGAHFNPALTLAFYRLGKVAPGDALAYGISHGAGAISGMGLAAWIFQPWLADPRVNFVVTQPGLWGTGAAWLAEFGMALVLMLVVLGVSNSKRHARFTGVWAASCVFVFITLESPVSGMSLNPARSLASALAARDGSALWVYFTAPPLGMLAAAEAFARLRRGRPTACAKLHHQNATRCLFCEYQAIRRTTVRIVGPAPLNRI